MKEWSPSAKRDERSTKVRSARYKTRDDCQKTRRSMRECVSVAMFSEGQSESQNIPSLVSNRSVSKHVEVTCLEGYSQMKQEPSLVREVSAIDKDKKKSRLSLKETISQIKSKLLRKSMPVQTNGKEEKDKFEKCADINYADFVDRHYKDVKPGVHRMNYSVPELNRVITDASITFAQEGTLIDIEAPIIVCGDIHGQFNDLVNMFLLLGRPPQRRFLFLGDYVDRGAMSLECITLLMAYKVLYPDHVYLLRGNHECARVNKKYGFMDECETVLPKDHAVRIWTMFQRAFNLMPVCALINQKILCMHGGLSPAMETFDDVRRETKPIRNPFKGVINDMLWADPDTNIDYWRTSSRGSGFSFGEEVIYEVCRKLNIDLVARAHQLCVDGFWTFADKHLITIFSAPAYCNLFKNAGAAMEVSTQDENGNETNNLFCKLIAFVPWMRGCEERIINERRLWGPELEAGYITDDAFKTLLQRRSTRSTQK